MRSFRTRLTCGAALAALAVTSCGGSPTATEDAVDGGGAAQTSEAESLYTELSALTGQERRDELVRRAEEEGQLAFYTSMNVGVADAVVEAFSDSFEVDVEIYRSGSETVLQRILQEQKANYAGNDVVETNATEMSVMSREGLFGEYAGERRDLVAEANRFEGWTADRILAFTPSWNTNLIKDVGVPASWEDLADPKYDGTLAMEVDDVDWYLTLYGYWQEQGKTEAEIDKLFADMAQGAKIVKGHAVMAELLSAGSFAVAASLYTYNVERPKRKGAPIDYLPVVDPVITRANGIGLMKTATHPAAAMLFCDWLLEEGQAVIAEEGLTPAIAVEGDDPLEGAELLPVDVDQLLDENDKWTEKYAAVVRGGEPVK